MKLKLIYKKNETFDIKSYIFSAQGGLKWKAGQFLIYSLPHENPDIRGIQRFFTISSAPFEKYVMLTTRIFPQNSSSFKKVLEKLKEGDLVDAKGPGGDFVVSEPDKNFVFIAGGIGIAPFKAILNDLNHISSPINVELLYANSNNEFAFKDELEKIASVHPSFKIHYVISPQHIDEQMIEQKVKGFKNKIFYVSGPEKMVEDFTEMLKGMGIKEKNIKQDFFPGYEPI